MHFGPNTTPMADVILVMLIFFMAGVALVGPKLFLTSALPSADAPRDETPSSAFTLPPANFTLKIARTDTGIMVAGIGPEPCTIEQARSRLHDLTGGSPTDDVIVTVSPAADVPFQAVVDVHDACRAAGIRRTALLTLNTDG
jgi:biopolymer transport protein ExbD